MKRVALLLVVVFATLGCGKSSKDAIMEEAERDHRAHENDPPPTEKKRELPASEKKEVKPPDPEPTTPKEIDDARKKAMIEGRDKDVVRFCEMGKIDNKSDPQAILGCTLAACRIMQTDKAKSWAAALT